MIAFLQRTPRERLEAFLEVSRATRLDSISVEKDFWVCWTLRELFTLPGIGDHLTFKGGTSLSKAWKLIERFSEDIDLIVEKEAIGFGGDAAPDKAPSNKQRRLRLEALMVACREWVQGRLMPGLTERAQAALGVTGWQIEVDPDMPDGQCLLFHYPSVFPASGAGYVRPVVKMGGLLYAQARHLPSLASGRPSRQLAGRLPGDARPDVLRSYPHLRGHDVRGGGV